LSFVKQSENESDGTSVWSFGVKEKFCVSRIYKFGYSKVPPIQLVTRKVQNIEQI
jgi:hypothetical protein